jgi:hypothetical protein
MGHGMRERLRDRGERFALHAFGKQAIVPGAAAAARAVFEACGGAAGWRSWVVADGRMVRIAHELVAKFFDDQPDATAEAAYEHLRSFPGFQGRPIGWSEAPMQVRGSYEAFRSVYLQLWVMVRAHDETMAQSLPARAALRLVHHEPPDNVVALPPAGQTVDGDL